MTREAKNWRQRGACLDEAPELFFPIGTTGPAALQLTQAKRVCAGCAVRDDCLEWALNIDVEGVWGGLTEEERRALRRRSARHRLASR